MAQPYEQVNSDANEESLRMVSSQPIGNEPVSDEELRPHVLDGFIGQPQLKAQLRLFLDAARKRETPPDHILLAGPPGLGKTTLAMIVANELEVPIRITSGPAIQHAGDLASILSSLEPGEVLFVDEVHRLPRAAEELLYIAMEDFRVDVMVGKGPGASSIPLTLPRFTMIGATTREGMLPSPLRARFGLPRIWISTRMRNSKNWWNVPPACSALGLTVKRRMSLHCVPGAHLVSLTGCYVACETGSSFTTCRRRRPKMYVRRLPCIRSMPRGSTGLTSPC